MSKGVSRKAIPRNINGKIISLTDKQVEQIKAIMESSTTSELIDRTQEIYKTKNRNTARTIIDENMKKPAIQSALDGYLVDSEEVLTETMNDFKKDDDVNKRKLAVDVAKFVHDKVMGKATQRTEVRTEGITLNIDLSSTLEED